MIEEEQVVRCDFPRSLWFLPLAMLAYLIQTVPTIGIFTMMLMGAAWPMLCVAATLIGIGFEVAVGRVHKGWLVLPLSTVSIYEGFAMRDHIHAWEVTDRSIEANRSNRTIFGPATEALVIRDSTSSSPLFEPEDLIARYRLPAVYVEGDPVPDGHPYRSMRLATKDQCVGRNGQTTGISDPPEGLDPRGCILSLRERPEGPIVLLASHRTQGMIGSMPVEMVVSTIHRPEAAGRDMTVQQGSVRPLSWIPMFYAGCGLDSASSGWRCGWAFARDRLPIDGRNPMRPEEAIARALSLKPMRRTERVFPSDPRITQRISHLKRQEVEEAFALVDGMMSKPMGEIRAERLQPILDDPERIETILPAMTRWMEANIAPSRLPRGNRTCNQYVEPESPACMRRNGIVNATTLSDILSRSTIAYPPETEMRLERVRTTIRKRRNGPTGWEAKRMREERRRRNYEWGLVNPEPAGGTNGKGE